jgi:hypothetical protein
MSVETLAEAVGEAADRRTLLRKVGAASLGAVAATLGVASTAEAVQWRCCNLCGPRNPNNCSGVTYCCWIWFCCCISGCEGRKRLHCAECYHSAAGGCDRGCDHVDCSAGYWSGNYC